MEYKILKISISDRIATVTISRPAVLNALNSGFFKEFNHFLDDLEPREDVRVLVITGEGKSFVAGADIAEMSDMTRNRLFIFLKAARIPFNGWRLSGSLLLQR